MTLAASTLQVEVAAQGTVEPRTESDLVTEVGEQVDRFKVGDEVEMRVVKLIPEEQKIGLSWKAMAEGEERREMDQYRASADGGATLADLFQSSDADED